MVYIALLIPSIILSSIAIYLIWQNRKLEILDNKEYDFLIDQNYYFYRVNENLAIKDYVNWSQYEN